jgi:hypothetical protein
MNDLQAALDKLPDDVKKKLLDKAKKLLEKQEAESSKQKPLPIFEGDDK